VCLCLAAFIFLSDLWHADIANFRYLAQHGSHCWRHHPDTHFELFSGSSSSGSLIPTNKTAQQGDIAFVPLAMPLMVGPGAIATTLGMTSLVKHSEFELASFAAIACAILATMLITYLCLAHAKNLFGRIGPMGIDAVTRIVGFFVSAMGVGLVFHGVIEALRDSGMLPAH
jgi:multiple antibiotic resistance protein